MVQSSKCTGYESMADSDRGKEHYFYEHNLKFLIKLEVPTNDIFIESNWIYFYILLNLY